MKGNFHVRFLEGGGLATARLHSVKAIWQEQSEKASHVQPWLTGTAPRGGQGVCRDMKLQYSLLNMDSS